MDEIDPHVWDLDDDEAPTCEQCGARLTCEEQGDGLMTGHIYVCYECPEEEAPDAT